MERLQEPPQIAETTYIALGGVGVGEEGWGKSSFSGIQDCVNARAEVQAGEVTAIQTRDSKAPEGAPALAFPPEAWTNFTGAL